MLSFYTRFYLSLLLSFFSTFAFSQSALDKASATACDCLKGGNLSSKTEEEAEKLMSHCVQQGMIKNLDVIQKEYDLDLTDESKVYEVGVELGKKLIVNCPAFLDYYVSKEKINSLQTEETEGSTQGKFSKLDVKDFAYLVIREKSGKESQFIWIRHFKNADQFVKNPEQLKNKTLKVNWNEYEAYLPKAGGYFKIKEIKSLEILD
jgi:hypothetical protein